MWRGETKRRRDGPWPIIVTTRLTDQIDAMEALNGLRASPVYAAIGKFEVPAPSLLRRHACQKTRRAKVGMPREH